MAGTVNRVPPGLLSLLEMKTQGQNPIALADQLVPTLDLYGNYVASNAKVEDGNTTGTIGAVGITAFVVAQAAPGELLIVPSATATSIAVLGAATTIKIRGGVYDIASSQMVLVGPQCSATVGDRPIIEFPRSMIVVPGQALAVFCEAFTGVAPTFRLAALIMRLRV